jgi:tetratricopeptide (TPR) repeat protein
MTRSSFLQIVALVAALTASTPMHRAARAQQITVSAADLFEYYESGEFDLVKDALERASKGDLGIVLDALRRNGRAWIEADGPEWRDRRRLMAATLALETARASLDHGWLASRGLIEWGADELAKGPPSADERVWQQAALALCEGARDTITIEAQLKRMRRRAADEPRIVLGEAFLREIAFWDERAAYWERADARPAIERLQAAAAHPAVRDEALLRLALLTIYDGRPEDALGYLQEIAGSPDSAHAYFTNLFIGWAHVRLGRPADASRAFEAALAAAPHARTATMNQVAALYGSGRRVEADRLLERDILQAQGPADPDPWLEYGYGDLRRFPLLIEQLRRSFR